jgi:signal transduction histidine kinase
MKLISEDYLGGTLSFHSSPEDGTCFILALPLE